MPALHERLSEQRRSTRMNSWLLFRRHFKLEDSVCGVASAGL